MSFLHRRILATALVLASAAVVTPTLAAAGGSSSTPVIRTESFEPLSLGSPDLPETRTRTEIAEGVTHTLINRGDGPADPSEIATTEEGPWRINILTIDPLVAKGELVATHGDDMGGDEWTMALEDYVAGLGGINAGFFTFSGEYPGEAAGLYVYEGEVLSKPSADPRETSLILSSQNDKIQITKAFWEGSLTNQQSGGSLAIENLNHPPVAPADPAADGDLSFLTDDFSTTTPTLSAGLEVVLNQHYCVTGTNTTGGTALAQDEYAVQATGSDISELKTLIDEGRSCLSYDSELTDDSGRKIIPNKHTYAVNGRVNLVEDGTIVADDRPGDRFFGRHPRTIAGVTGDGMIKLVVVDGRSTTSVGATIPEAARVAQELGMVDALNLDGGGSSTMSINGEAVNVPSDKPARPVGDALVWIPAKNP